ncbi:hypothetical protein DERF_004654 [Dermatophagoides farinae]|uniref:Uncharacterized protein n=1 Tax=Dermatophagoides farinae TaxID=6954 RepID=A0A922I6L1_DERFA|nr:hypothetical protein DERF_004654 [Dermatophagoides farinae]
MNGSSTCNTSQKKSEHWKKRTGCGWLSFLPPQESITTLELEFKLENLSDSKIPILNCFGIIALATAVIIMIITRKKLIVLKPGGPYIPIRLDVKRLTDDPPTTTIHWPK